MRIVRNERRIKLYSSIGQYATLGGLAVLLAGLVISFVRPTWMLPVVISMGAGFLLSSVGGFFADQYAGSLAHHKALAEVLKGLDYRHTLLQYVLPADHVLLEPGGCTVFVVKSQGGDVVYQDGENGRWKHSQRGKIFRRFVGQPGIGKPHEEAQDEVKKLQAFLDGRLENAGPIPVRGVIVFVNEEVQLQADDSPLPAFYRKKVKDWLRGPGDLRSLPDDVQERLADALGLAEEQTGR
ncbi:MAG: nuclease-related domain-containing protein [Anaerolineae bacterium]|jgi:hypothetical protein